MGIKYGIDVSAKRLDGLDKEILKFAISHKSGPKMALDLGCGFGRVSVVLAMLGFEVYLFDIKDLHQHFANVSTVLNLSGKLKFYQKDIRTISKDIFEKQFSIVIAQRTLHYLKFGDAQVLLNKVSEITKKGGAVFASFSGLESELANGYKCKKNKIENRFCNVSDDVGERFNIKTKVCLYDMADVTRLFLHTGLLKRTIRKTRFGNIRSIYYKPHN